MPPTLKNVLPLKKYCPGVGLGLGEGVGVGVVTETPSMMKYGDASSTVRLPNE